MKKKFFVFLIIFFTLLWVNLECAFGEYVFVAKWGSLGTGNGEFNGPWRIAIDAEGFVYVTDASNHYIQKFDSVGNFITKWGSYGTGDGQFMGPEGIAIDPDGYVYVAEAYNSRIQKFDSVGNFITKWGSEGTGDGQFNGPDGVAIDADGYVYVADHYNDRIQKFDSEGNFITKWGSHGTGDGQFYGPDAIAIDTEGYIYVAEHYNSRVQKFDSALNFITKWGSYGTGDGQFRYTTGVAVDTKGYVYVADDYNDRIRKFDSEGTFITKWGSQGSEDGQFIQPRGIAVDAEGYVYVADWGNHRIQKFRELPFTITVDPYSDEYVIMVGSAKDESTGKLFYIPIYPDGTFGSVSEVTDLGYRSGAGIADFDNDGDLDFVAGAIVERGPERSFADFYLFENIGNGNFAQLLIASHVDAGEYVNESSDNRVGTFAVADFNGDGYKDFVVPIYRSDHIYLFTNNGGNTFTLSALSPLVNPFDAKEGDFDEDGCMDFVVTDYFNEGVYLYKGDGNGGFTDEYLFALPTIPSYQRAADITVGYFDKDGHLDIIVDDFRGAGGGHLYIGNGDGSFKYNGLAYSRPIMGAYPFGVDSYDFDKDGKMDLILSTYDTPPIGPVFFEKGNGDGTFQAPIQISTYPFGSLGGVFPVTPSYIPRPVIEVNIDIKPGSYPNSINLGSKGLVPVAVLTTNSFDASTVDPSTVEFAGASPVRWTMEDVDFDGDMDLLFHFKTQELSLNENSTEAALTGTTYGGQPIEGTDTVNIVPKGKSK